MSRLTLPLAILIAAGVALPGCAKNKALPTQLAPSRMTSIGVNAYLWRAAVDTLSFAPLITADSSGGVIVTDWYTNPNTPGERVKLTVSIIDQDLRADALRVAASRQVNQSGVWVDAPVAAATVQKLEDIILTRARDLRRTTVGG
jgi:alpha-beta hydrolase superfamily lysophospholipase